jgi:hypothetical protein
VFVWWCLFFHGRTIKQDVRLVLKIVSMVLAYFSERDEYEYVKAEGWLATGAASAT